MDRSAFATDIRRVDFSGVASGRAPVAAGFPHGLGEAGVHEICAAGYGDGAACAGFAVAAGLSKVQRGALVWIGLANAARDQGELSGRGLAALGACPGRLLQVRVQRPMEALWAVEEALSCSAVGCVVGELAEADFTATRRLTLASRRHGRPVILLMPQGREGATGADARWRVSPRPSAPDRFDPRAPGRPRWRAILERSRSAPRAVSAAYDLEFDHETLCLRLVSGLAAGQAAPQSGQPETTERAGFRRTG